MDLALPKVEKKIVKVEQFSHKCYFLNSFKHNLHGENMQLNSLVDWIISLGTHLEKQDTLSIYQNKSPSNLMHNLDYIKIQNNDILRSLGLTKTNSNYFKDLDSKYTKITQLLEEIKQLIITWLVA